MSIVKTLAKGTFWGVAAAFFLKIIGFGYYIVLARMVPEENIGEMGLFFHAFSIISVIIIFSDLGLGPGAISRYVPYYSSRREYNYVKKTFKLSIYAGTLFSLLCIIILSAFSSDISRFLGEPKLAPLLQIMSSYLLVYNFYSIAYGFLVGRKLIKRSSYMSSIQGLTKLILTIIFLYYYSSVAGSITTAFVLSFVVASVYGMVWVAREYKNLPNSEEKVDSRSLLIEMVPFGITSVFLASMSSLNSFFDRLMFGFFLPSGINEEVIGVYSIIIGFTSVMAFFSTPLSSIFGPVITEAIGRKDDSELKKTSAIFIRWIIMSTVPIILMIVLFSGEILTVVYGPAYSKGSSVLIIYSLGLFIFSFSYPVQGILMGLKKMNITASVLFAGTILNIVLNILLIPVYRMEGAAFASAVSFIMMTGLFIHAGRDYKFEMPKNVYKLFLAGFLTLLPFIIFKMFNGGLLNFMPVLLTSDNLLSEILRKLFKVCLMGAIFFAVSFTYLFFLIFFRSFSVEDTEVLTGGLRKLGAPPGFINLVKRVFRPPGTLFNLP